MSTNDDHLDAMIRALGREIQAERRLQEKDVETLAALAHVSATQLGRIERGERGQFAEVWRVAEALGLSLSHMIAEAERRTSADRQSS